MNLDETPCFLIHRKQDTIREASIRELESHIGKLQHFEGISGHFLINDGFPRKHPHEGESSPGNIGCTASHIEILDRCVKMDYLHCAIFEDDAELVGDINAYFKDVETLPPADILFMGVNEIVKGTDTTVSSIKKITRFWGTHAVFLTNKAMVAILETYKKYVDLGYALPADWLYSYAIQQYELTAYAPIKPVIRQRPGFVSLISGNIRR